MKIKISPFSNDRVDTSADRFEKIITMKFTNSSDSTRNL